MKHKKYFWSTIGICLALLVGVIIIQSYFFTITNYRSIASIDDNSIRSNFFNEVKNMESILFSDSIKNEKDCATIFNQLYLRLSKVRSSDITIDFLDDEMFWLMEMGFKSQLRIRDILKELENKTQQQLVGKSCLTEMRNFARALRYAQDYVATKMLETPTYQKPTNGYITLEDDYGPHFFINPAYKDKFKSWRDLESGDLIVSRGNAFTSAAIARFTEVETQFSHLSLVYKDDAGNLFTSEAHIEIGNVAAPFSSHIKEENSRTVVYRFHNPEIAKRAAKIMYNRIYERNLIDDNIRYDFAMDLTDPKDLFCSEVAHLGFKLADPNIFIPKYTSSFELDLLPFLQQVGIKVNKENIKTFQAFSPGDMEFDTRFDIVAEWKNFDKLKESRIKDVILTKIFDWIKNEKYKLEPDLTTHLSSDIFFVGRRTPLIQKYFAKHFPKNMNPKQIAIFRALDKVGAILQKKIEQIEVETQTMLTPIEMLEALENYRKEELLKTKKVKPGTSDLHFWLKPPRGK